MQKSLHMTPTRRKLLYPFLGLTFFACAQEKSEKVETLDMMVQTLRGVLLDDDFFQALEKVRSTAETDKNAKEVLARFELSALAVAMTYKQEALKRLFQSETPSRERIGLFVQDVSEKTQNPEVAQGLRSLSFAITGQPTDLTKTIEVAQGESEFSGPVSLLLAHFIIESLSSAVTAPEYERGIMLQQIFPGIPTPPSNDPLESVFPRTLRILSSLFEHTDRDEGLRVAFEHLKTKAHSLLAGKKFALPVVLDRKPRGGFPGNGLVGFYTPLFVTVFGDKGISVGRRPVVMWDENRLVVLEKGEFVPLLGLTDLEALKDEKRRESVGLLEKHRHETASIEKQVYSEVSETRATAIAFSGSVPTRALFSGLSLLKEAGFDDLRLLVPGAPSRVLPFFFRDVPQKEGTKPPSPARVVVVLSKNEAEIYPSDSKKALQTKKEWGNEVRTHMKGGKPVGLSVGWDKERGFKGLLAMVLEDVSKGSHLVKVMVRSKDVPSEVVLDCISEIVMAKGEPFTDIAHFFSGISCSGTSFCPSFLPLFVTEGSLPATTKAVVEETRPANFCDPKDVERIMKGRSGAFRACYEYQLQRNPELKGRLVLRFTILEDGSTSDVSIVSNELNTHVAECVKRHVQSLVFPKPVGGTCEIRWPFSFQPGGD